MGTVASLCTELLASRACRDRGGHWKCLVYAAANRRSARAHGRIRRRCRPPPRRRRGSPERVKRLIEFDTRPPSRAVRLPWRNDPAPLRRAFLLANSESHAVPDCASR